jgi:photosystem II stability/assembly factor-like uncharacterized protein
MFDTYIGTTDGVYRLQRRELEPLGLDGERIWAVHAFRDQANTIVLAGSYGNGMFRSSDGGQSWLPANDGLTASAFRCIGPDPLRPGSLLAGTEPGRIFRSTDNGRSWSELSGITRIEGHADWFLPYSPRAGAVRNVYAPDLNGRRMLASVEVGGLLDSVDGGESWTCEAIGIDDDIHHITGHPDDPALLYASLGYASLRHDRHAVDGRRFGGIARSRDGGGTWEKLENDYTRATLIPPSRKDLLVAGPAPKVGQEGRIVVSADGGDTWLPASNGIDTPMPDMVELFVAAPDDSIWAVCSGGRLLRAEAGTWHWTSAVPDDSEVNVQSVTFVPR